VPSGARAAAHELDRFGQYVGRDSKYAAAMYPASSRDYRGQTSTAHYERG